MAAGVVGDAVGEVGAYVFEAELFGEELGELVDAGEEGGYVGDELPVAELGSHFGVVLAHHGYAGGGGDDYGFGVLELGDEAGEKGEGFGLVAGVPVHLAAAGLAGGEDDGVAQALEEADHGFSRVGEEGVVVAGDEEGYLHGLVPTGSRRVWRSLLGRRSLSEQGARRPISGP